MTAALCLAQITPFVTEAPTAFELAAGYVGVGGGAALCTGLAFADERRAERAGGRSIGATLRSALRPAVLGLAACGLVLVAVAGLSGAGEWGEGVVGVLLMAVLYVPVAWALAVAASLVARAVTPKGADAGELGGGASRG